MGKIREVSDKVKKIKQLVRKLISLKKEQSKKRNKKYLCFKHIIKTFANSIEQENRYFLTESIIDCTLRTLIVSNNFFLNYLSQDFRDNINLMEITEVDRTNTM